MVAYLFTEQDLSKNAQPKPRRSSARTLTAPAQLGLAQPNDSNTQGGSRQLLLGLWTHIVLMTVWLFQRNRFVLD